MSNINWGSLHAVGTAQSYTQSLRQVIASMIPVALLYDDQDEALKAIQEAMEA